MNRGRIVMKGQFKSSQVVTAALIDLYMQVWDDIRLLIGTWCSEQLPDLDSLSVAAYLETE